MQDKHPYTGGRINALFLVRKRSNPLLCYLSSVHACKHSWGDFLSLPVLNRKSSKSNHYSILDSRQQNHQKIYPCFSITLYIWTSLQLQWSTGQLGVNAPSRDMESNKKLDIPSNLFLTITNKTQNSPPVHVPKCRQGPAKYF